MKNKEPKIKLYHLIYGHKMIDIDGVITPYIPENTVINEDKSIKRICVARSIDECLTGIEPSIIGVKSCLDLIYKNEKDISKIKFPFTIAEFEMVVDDECLLSPDKINKYVPDAKLTGEYWITKEMKPSSFKTVWLADGDIIEEPFKYNGKTYIFVKVQNAKFSDKEELPSVKLREGIIKQATAWAKNNLIENKNKSLDRTLKECNNNAKNNNDKKKEKQKEEYKMKAVNIIWDVDCKEDLEELPKEIELPEELEDEDDISDYLSDMTGFCHKGFKLVENKALNIDDQIINASTHNERLYITDITGVIGEWLDMDHQDIEPEIIKKLEDVYQMAVKELEEPLKKPIKGDNKAR